MRRLLLAAAFLPAALAAQPKEKAAPNPAFAPIVADPNLPNVLLIGDSISIGYTLPTRELLKGKANLFRVPTNAGPTIRSLPLIDEWLGGARWAVIHFNWGLHDLRIMDTGRHQVPIEEYEKNLDQLVTRMAKTGAKLIWATTTPVPGENVSPPRRPADVERYNQAALRVARRHRLAVNDLYAAVLPRLAELQLPNNVHFKPEGSQFLAEKVAAAILRSLPKR